MRNRLKVEVNSSSPISFDRCVDSRTDRYQLCAFADSNKFIYDVVEYIVNLNTNKVSLLLSKNKLINNTPKEKSIPSLEMQAVQFFCEILIYVINELSRTAYINPINIEKTISLY